MHQLARTGLAVAAVGALGAAFAAGVAFGSQTPVAAAMTPAAHREQRHPARQRRPAARASCDELLEWYVDHGVDRVTPYGWDYLRVYTLDGRRRRVA